MVVLRRKKVLVGLCLVALIIALPTAWLTYSAEARVWLKPVIEVFNQRKGTSVLKPVPVFDNFESAYVSGVTALVIGGCVTIFMLLAGISYLAKFDKRENKAEPNLWQTIFYALLLVPVVVGGCFLPIMLVLNLFSQPIPLIFGLLVGLLFPLAVLGLFIAFGLAVRGLFLGFWRGGQKLLKFSTKHIK
jgi:hypothetical protein